MGGKSFKDILWKIFRFVFLGFMALISVGPLVWIVMSSFKSNKEILSSAFALPTSLSFNGYKAALDLAPIFKFYGNSVVISFTSTLLNILIVSMDIRLREVPLSHCFYLRLFLYLLQHF